MSDNDGFETLCGIDDGCSEEFFEQSPMVKYADKKHTTCKRCLLKWEKEEAKAEEMESFLLEQVKALS